VHCELPRRKLCKSRWISTLETNIIFCVNLLDLPTYHLSMETTHHKKVLQREHSSSLSSRHPVPTLTPLPLCSGTSECLSMGEEVSTMQIRVLGEIKNE
jgi:hypothetical protein